MNDKEIIKKAAHYFSKKVIEFGDSPKGVDWNSIDSQLIRLSQVIKLIDGKDRFSINDLGCGNGQLIEKIKTDLFPEFRYIGSDISKEMIDLSTLKYKSDERVKFIHIQKVSDIPVCDFTIASGIFNMKLSINVADWEKYIFNTLSIMNEKSTKGFSFNMLTSYSDKEKMRDDLYYADPCIIFDFCKKNFSKNISLLHDYDLYDFTIIIRK